MQMEVVEVRRFNVTASHYQEADEVVLQVEEVEVSRSVRSNWKW